MKFNSTKFILCFFALSLTTVYNACGSRFQVDSVLTEERFPASVSPITSIPTDVVQTKVCTQPQKRGLADFASRRLTKTEILNSFTDLFGSVAMTKTNVTAAVLPIPDDSTAHEKSQFDPVLQSSHIESVIGLAEQAVIAVRPFRNELFGGCVNATPVTKDCFTNFVKSFGKRAWRRPLTNADVESFVATFWNSDAKSFEDVVPALLASPEFLMILESRALTEGIRNQLNSYEVAARISFLTISSIPDSILISAADKNELSSVEQVRSQVQRLLNTPRGKSGVIKSVLRYVGGENIADPSAIAGIAQGLPNSGSTVGLGNELKQEMIDYVSYIIFDKNGTYEDLMTNTSVFPKSTRVAAIYKTAVWKTMDTPPTAPSRERAGLWTRAALLATTNSHTKPFSRGVNFRQRILCQTLPSPDPDVITSREELILSLSPLEYSNREIHARITNSTSCMGCHSQINPIGFGLESFNELGSFRTTELVLGAKGETLASHPVDSSVQLQLNYNTAPVSVTRVDDFIKNLTINATARSCFAQTLFQERRLRAATENDNCALSSLESDLRDNKTILSVFTDSIANEDIFWNGSK